MKRNDRIESPDRFPLPEGRIETENRSATAIRSFRSTSCRFSPGCHALPKNLPLWKKP